jgi:hypothetical protein
MAQITKRAGWQILEDVNKIINNAKLIYKNDVPKNFETLKTKYKETMVIKQALAKSITAQNEANKELYNEELRMNWTLAELDEVVTPSKSKTNETSKSKTPVMNSALYKNDPYPPIQHYEPRTLARLKRAIKRHEELVREVLKKIETIQTEHKTIEDNYKVSIDHLKKELVELIGQDYAPALRSLFESVDTKQKEMERASREMLFSKWDTMDRRSGGSRRKRKQRRQTRQTKRR